LSYYTYIVDNNLWDLRVNQRTEKGYFELAPEFAEKIMDGSFSEALRDRFVRIIEYYGQDPYIIRSSSILDGRHLLIYTAHNEHGKGEELFREETQCLAFGDGENYEKYEANPILTYKDMPEGAYKADFRDPKIWFEDARLRKLYT
jgi:hypothetical protein